MLVKSWKRARVTELICTLPGGLEKRFIERGSILAFPLQTSEGKVLGAFAVYWREPHEATPEDVAFASTVADVASIIVARHIEAEERKRAEAALAVELKP